MDAPRTTASRPARVAIAAALLALTVLMAATRGAYAVDVCDASHADACYCAWDTSTGGCDGEYAGHYGPLCGGQPGTESMSCLIVSGSNSNCSCVATKLRVIKFTNSARRARFKAQEISRGNGNVLGHLALFGDPIRDPTMAGARITFCRESNPTGQTFTLGAETWRAGGSGDRRTFRSSGGSCRVKVNQLLVTVTCPAVDFGTLPIDTNDPIGIRLDFGTGKSYCGECPSTWSWDDPTGSSAGIQLGNPGLRTTFEECATSNRCLCAGN